MKPIKSILILTILCAPALASAQGYGPGGPGYQGSTVPGGFHNRAGRLIFGFGLGLGGMSDNGSAITTCDNCDFKPLAGEFDIHLGGMLSPRFGLMFEGQANVQTIHSSFFDGDTTLTQGAAMLAGQYWLIPQLWIKGGIGFANLQLQDADAFGVFAASQPENGTALMGAVGFELLSSQFFSVDLQGRLINGSYKGLDDNVTALSIGVGLNWY